MKQEHEMTPGVLVSGDDMSAGDYKARCAVLEDEVADHKRLQAETERLQGEAARARIAELVLALRTVVGMLHHKATTPLERESIKIAEAALAAHQSGGAK